MKKILFISLMTSLFLAFTACGPKEEKKSGGGELTEEQNTDKPNFFIHNDLSSVVTVKTACGTSILATGKCTAILNEQAEDLEISVQWSTAEGAEPVVLCGPGEGNEACQLQDQVVGVTPDAEGNNAPGFKPPVFTGKCNKIHCQEEEEEEGGGADDGAGGADDGAGGADDETDTSE